MRSMGDGGVACAPSQLPMVPEALCGANGAFAFKSDKKMKKAEREEEAVRKGDSSSERGRKLEEKVKTRELEKGEFVPDRRRKEELEKGEFVPDKLRKVELEKGEFVPDKLRKGDLEKGEFVPDKLSKSELERGEFVLDKSRKFELEKGEFVPEKWRKGELEKGEFVPEKCRKGELEKGEFVPDKSRKGEFLPDKWRKEDLESGEFVPDKVRRGSEVERGQKVELEKGEILPDKWRKSEWEHERSPEDFHRRKDVVRGENDHRKKSSLKWESGTHERDLKISSRNTDDDLCQPRYDHSNGKVHGKEHFSGNLWKRHGFESETNSRKHHGEFGDYPGSKSRRISEDVNRSNYTERQGRISSSSVSKMSSTNRYASSRHHESALPSRAGNDRQVRSPGLSERSPHEHVRHHDHRERTPGYSERSPHDRTRRHDHKDRNVSHSERSPFERVRYHDHRERSPRDRGRMLDHREKSRKSGGNEKQPNIRCDDKVSRRDSDGKDSYKSSTKLPSNSSITSEKSSDDKSNKEKKSRTLSLDHGETLLPPPPPLAPPPPPPPPPSQPHVNGIIEEQPSMEEDMDICDTPPHAMLPSNSETGKWYYLDHFGVEQGPSRLGDLKSLVEEGVLISDHLIKHSDSDRWVTVENATSPLVPSNLPFIVSDAVTQMASPPEASGNLLVEAGDVSEEAAIPAVQQDLPAVCSSLSLGVLENFQIDERVEAILNGYSIIQGKELETIGGNSFYLSLICTFSHQLTLSI